jgi:hypothetical protein
MHTNPLQAQAAQSLINCMNTFEQVRKAAANLSSDIHRHQEATNSRLSDACRRFRETEAEAPERILPVVARGKPFRQPKTFSSGLFLRYTAPEEVNAFRAQAVAKPDFSSLEQFRGCLMNPPDKFTISRPEYFLDCWLEEEEARQRKRQYKRGAQTKRPREEKFVVPEVTRTVRDEFGVVTKVVVEKSVAVDAHSRSPSFSVSLESPLDTDLVSLPDVPVAAKRATKAPEEQALPAQGLPKRRSHSASRHSASSSTVSSEGLPKPKRTRVPPPFVAPDTLPRQRPIEVTNITEPDNAPVIRLTPEQPVPEVKTTPVRRKSPMSFHDHIKGGAGKKGLKSVKQEPRKKDFRPAFIRDIQGAKAKKQLKKATPVPKVKDYRPAWIQAIETKPALKPVDVRESMDDEDERTPTPTGNPLFDMLKAMRKKMGTDEDLEAPDSRFRASSECSDW